MGYVLRVRLASFFAGAATASVAGLYLLHKDYKIAHEAVSQQADVMRLIDDFNNKSLNWRLNTTLISIIPKVKERYQIMDFRSIGLLSSIYKDTARDILSKAAGVVVIDDRASNHFPTPLEVSNKDDVAVGRIRQDLSQEGNHGLDIFVCGDQIRKGAALNAIQIAELLL